MLTFWLKNLQPDMKTRSYGALSVRVAVNSVDIPKNV